MCDMKSLNGWTLLVLYSFNSWTQRVQVSVFGQIRLIKQISQKNFGKPKLMATSWYQNTIAENSTCVERNL